MIVDIFDPKRCDAEFKACMTAEQIDIYLWQQLSALKSIYNSFSIAQTDINNKFNTNINGNADDISIVKTDVYNNGRRIKALETAMVDIETAANNFKLDVSQTLNLFQTTINTLTASVTDLTNDEIALQNRVSVLESSVNLAALQNIIQTYNDIWNDFQTKLDELESILRSDFASKFNELEGDFNSFTADVNETIRKNELYMKHQLEKFNEKYNEIVNSDFPDRLQHVEDENARLMQIANNALGISNTALQTAKQNESAIANVVLHAGEVDNKIEDINVAVTNLNTAFTNLNSRMESVETKLDSQRILIEQNQNINEAQEEQLTANTSKILVNGDYIDRLEKYRDDVSGYEFTSIDTAVFEVDSYIRIDLTGWSILVTRKPDGFYYSIVPMLNEGEMGKNPVFNLKGENVSSEQFMLFMDPLLPQFNEFRCWEDRYYPSIPHTLWINYNPLSEKIEIMFHSLNGGRENNFIEIEN